MGPRGTWLLVALLTLTAACSGRRPVDARGPATGSPGAAGTGAGGGGAGAGAAGLGGADIGAAGTGGAGAGTAGTGPKTARDPGHLNLRLLTNREYDNTVQDLLGVAGHARQTFQADPRENEFESSDANNIIVGERYEQYFNSAEALADAAFADPVLRARVLTCEPSLPSSALVCARTVIAAFGKRAWRRPLSPTEIDELAALATNAIAEGQPYVSAMRRTVTALLSSAPFLYRLELDPDPMSLAAHPLTPWELATRLSYLVWSTMPDERLFSLAADGTLARDDVLASEVERLLADPRASQFADTFVGGWLIGGDLTNHQVDPQAFARWDEELRASMMGEVRLYTAEFLHGDRSMATFLDADVNFVNARLAAHYGLPTAGLGAALQRVEVTTDRRRGLMGLAAFLTANSFGYRTSPTFRGTQILGQVLCNPPPSEPPDIVPPLDPNPPPPNQTFRQKVEGIRDSGPLCAACHKIIDPIGLGLEEFDFVGRFRSVYDDATPVDTSGALPDGTPFVGEAELALLLERDPRYLACVARKALTFALGRQLNDVDEAVLRDLGSAWAKQGTTLRALMRDIVLDDTFRFRRGEAKR